MDDTEQVATWPMVRSRWLARLVRLWAWTWRVHRHDDSTGMPDSPDGAVLLAFWHEDLAVLGPLHADRGFVGMVSRSRDGELLAGVLGQLGYAVVRGSTSSGGRAVALAALRALRSGQSVAVAVDGPRGPRRAVQPGTERLARLADCAVVLVRCRAWPALRLGSWDRQRIPAPFARVVVRYARWQGTDLRDALLQLGEADTLPGQAASGATDPSERAL